MSKDFWLLDTSDPAWLRNSKTTFTSFKNNSEKILDVANDLSENVQNTNFTYFVFLATQNNKHVDLS
jgi:hypothetical protein